VKYDTSKTGWETIRVDYAADILEKFILEWRPTGEPFEMDTRRAFEYELAERQEQDLTISRASVIFELNKMADMGLLTWRDKTGKGGHHKVYRLAMTPHELEALVVTRLLKHVKENWPQAYAEVVPKLEDLEG